MQFDESDEIRALRLELREIIEQTVDEAALHEAHESGTNRCPALYRAMGQAGLVGRAISGVGTGGPLELFTITHELEKAATPYDAIAMVIAAAAVVARTASDDLRDEVMPRLLSGESLVCLGLTEPDAGSDLANVQTRAVRDGNDWIVSGSKVWTTMAHVADWCLLLARTGESYTVFLMPMDRAGIRVEPIWTLSTERSNSLFLDEVRIEERYVLGEVDAGWRTLSVMLSFERGMGNIGFGIPMLRRFVTWARETGIIDEPRVRDVMARTAIDNEVSRLLMQRAVWTAAQGNLGGAEGSIAKVFATEAYQRASQELQAIAGPDGLLGFGAPGAAAAGWIDYDARHSVPQTIQGGTSEINRNTIAERHFGLPKTR